MEYTQPFLGTILWRKNGLQLPVGSLEILICRGPLQEFSSFVRSFYLLVFRGHALLCY